MIETILHHKQSADQILYLVKRKNRPYKEATWEPAGAIGNRVLIRDYLCCLPLTPPTRNLPHTDRIRVLLLGNPEVGKTTLIRRLCERPFSRVYEPTGFYAVSAITSWLDIIEIPGTEIHRTLPLETFSYVDRIVVLLAMDDAETLYTYTKWIHKFQHLNKPVKLIVNKSDMDAEPQTTVVTMMSLRAAHDPWTFVSCLTDSAESLTRAILR
jgi:GTPase SAR1 family protein